MFKKVLVAAVIKTLQAQYTAIVQWLREKTKSKNEPVKKPFSDYAA